MIEFNEYGYLIPADIHNLELDEIEYHFGFNEHRQHILQAFKALINDLRLSINESFTVWIDGSFVTKKTFPNDIDIVVFVSEDSFIQKQDLLSALKSQNKAVDLYFIKVFSENHPNAQITVFDRLDWFHFFRTDRKNRKKGFIEIKFTHGNPR